METLQAAFTNREDVDRAIAALREQGVVDIQVETDTGALQQNSVTAFSLLNDIFGDATTPLTLNVVVETSRYRQAEDTIAKFGGQR